MGVARRTGCRRDTVGRHCRRSGLTQHGGDGSVQWGPGSKTQRAETGSAAEDAALAHLRQAGLTLLERNYRVAAGPSRRAGEVDLIMRDRDGTLVFVEVRARASCSHGGAAASVTSAKQRKRHLRSPALPAASCRRRPAASTSSPSTASELQWLPAAFHL